MKRIVFTLIMVLALVSCKPAPTFFIDGEMDDHSCDGLQMFLVPAEGSQTSETVDSVVIKDAKFHFEGNKEQVSILRLGWKHRLYHQELCVVTEPGNITAYISRISSAHGTPQNDSLQQWKETRERIDSVYVNLRHELKSAKSQSDTLRLKDSMALMEKSFIDYNYQFLKRQPQTILNAFLYKMTRSVFSEEQKMEMDSIINKKAVHK